MSTTTEPLPQKNNKGKPHLIILIAVAILAGLSFLPWSKITGGRIKDFNLVGDLLKNQEIMEPTAVEPVDPELQKEMLSGVTKNKTSENKLITKADSAFTIREPINPRNSSGEVIIEDYTPGSSGLLNLATALKDKSRLARIAVIGDSYIEGDILTQNLRSFMQERYGGRGVGYVPADSPHKGFRTSVRQTASGWKVHDIRNDKSDTYKWLSGEHFTASNGATVTYTAGNKLPGQSSWGQTRVVYTASSPAKITINTDSAVRTFNISPTQSAQSISLTSDTQKAKITVEGNGVEVLGVFLDEQPGKGGVQVDNMSMRGNSGITHRKLNVPLTTSMRDFIDYDLIVVEYGLNALTSTQKNYSAYGKLMEQTIKRLKDCYPHADILMLGIGDRGQKLGSQVASMPTAQAMTNAQRDAARNTGILFWDIREAMGGNGSVVNWHKKGLINSDFIHLNAKGGAQISTLLSKAISTMLNSSAK